MTVTTVAAAESKHTKHLVHPSLHQLDREIADLPRRLSTPVVVASLARPAVAPPGSDRRSPGQASLGADLPSKPRLDSLFNTHGDLAKFRQLLRESTDETASEERVNYCCEVTTARIESWLKSVRAARFSSGGLCRMTADESLESEQAIRKLRNGDDHTHPDVKH